VEASRQEAPLAASPPAPAPASPIAPAASGGSTAPVSDAEAVAGTGTQAPAGDDQQPAVETPGPLPKQGDLLAHAPRPAMAPPAEATDEQAPPTDRHPPQDAAQG
jgi:hypothetical protein